MRLSVSRYSHIFLTHTKNIIELKYLRGNASESEVNAAVKQAEAQVCRYAETVNVNDNIGHTILHKVYVVYRGVEMVACDEIAPTKKQV